MKAQARRIEFQVKFRRFRVFRDQVGCGKTMNGDDDCH